MKIRINGETITEAKRIEVSQEASDTTAWGVVLIGILACIGWWQLW